MRENDSAVIERAKRGDAAALEEVDALGDAEPIAPLAVDTPGGSPVEFCDDCAPWSSHATTIAVATNAATSLWIDFIETSLRSDCHSSVRATETCTLAR